MVTQLFRPLLIASALLAVGACAEKEDQPSNNSPQETPREKAVHQIELKAPKLFSCLLFLEKFGNDVDQTRFKPAKTYSDYYRAELVKMLEREPLKIWMPHWKTIELSQDNIDAQVKGNLEEFSKRDSVSMSWLMIGCVRPALIAGIGPSAEVKKARARKAADDAEMRAIVEANTAK